MSECDTSRTRIKGKKTVKFKYFYYIPVYIQECFLKWIQTDVEKEAEEKEQNT